MTFGVCLLQVHLVYVDSQEQVPLSYSRLILCSRPEMTFVVPVSVGREVGRPVVRVAEVRRRTGTVGNVKTDMVEEVVLTGRARRYTI